jgi:hypothetical protein
MITPALLKSWGAYDEQLAVFGVTAMSPRELAARNDISLSDRMWILGRTLAHIDEHAARLCTIEIALGVAHLAGDDEATFRGLMNDLLVAEDLDLAARNTALIAAWDYAWHVWQTTPIIRRPMRDAVWKTAEAATRIDVYNAVWDAACDAAWAVAKAVTWDAVWGAARDAVLDTVLEVEMEQSLARALEWLGDYADGWEEP